jgi:hypothetical protein
LITLELGQQPLVEAEYSAVRHTESEAAMWMNLVVGLAGSVLLVVLLVLAERELKKMMRRHLDRSRRFIRSVVYLAGVAAWAYASYAPLHRFGGLWWFMSFLVVSGLWKLVVDVLIFGVPDRPE